MGAANLRDIVSMRGKTLESHYQERAQEVALRKLAARNASTLYGVDVDDREMSMLTPNEMASSNGSSSRSLNDVDEDEDLDNGSRPQTN
jgi:hypothetical protein